MAAIGSFSYKNDSINGFNIGNSLQVRVEAININIAKIYVTDGNGNPQQIPGNMQLQTAAGVGIPPYNNEFLIVWIDTYVLSVGGAEVLRLVNQKQQSFIAGAGTTHFMV